MLSSCPFCFVEGDHVPHEFSHSVKVSGSKHDLTVRLTCSSWECVSCGTTWNDMPEISDGQLEVSALEGRDFTIVGLHRSIEDDE